MRLYYTPAACSLAPHIVAREAGYDIALEKVDLGSGKTETGKEFRKVNPKGYVPALELDDGQVLTEAAVVMQYLADQKPDAGLAPRPGTMDRYRLMEALNFAATEVHKQIGALFNPSLTPEMKEVQKGYITRRLDALEQMLAGRQFIMGDRFSIADAYLFTVVNWTNFHQIDLGRWPNIQAFMGRVGARPKVQEALKAEGLAK